MDKTTLRLELKAKRQALSTEQWQTMSQQVIEQVIDLVPWPKIKSIHLYMPVESRREVDTWPLLEHALMNAGSLTVAVPVMDGETMLAKQVSSASSWQKNSRGIPEPQDAAVIDQKFDVIIVPLLGFDAQGYRIGNGGGHYDRFLAAQPQAMTIGIGYELGRLESFKHEAHDIPLTHIVTEHRMVTP